MWMTLGILGLIIFIIGIAFLIVTLIKKWSPIIPTVLLCSGGFLMIIGFVFAWGTSPVMEEASEEERERDPEQYENFIKGASIPVSYDEMVNASEKIEGFISVEGVVSDSVGGGIENFILKSYKSALDMLISVLLLICTLT